MFCEKCGSQVNQGEVFCQNCGNQIGNNNNYYQTNVLNTGRTTTDKNPTMYIVFAVLEIVLCCWPLGIPALIYAAGANTALKNGDIETVESKLKTSKIFLLIGIIGSIVIGILYAILLFSSEVMYYY